MSEQQSDKHSSAPLEIVCQALTDPENQPHQWIGDRDRLIMEIVDIFSRMQK